MTSEKLIDRITDQILERYYSSGSSEGFSCRAVCVEEDADKVRFFIECGAERLGVQAEKPSRPGELARFIDHTLLKPTATRSQIESLSREALEYGFASVCVNPVWVPTAHRILGGSKVATCSVVGFPLGANGHDTKAYETRRCIFDGATEIDMVMNIGALKSGADDVVWRDFTSVVEACREGSALLKVIIEAAYLTDEEKVKACTLAKKAGADFVKTSTGFGPGGATVEDVALMRRTVGPDLGVKAAGGIGDSDATRKMIGAGATRIGASAGIKIVQSSAAANTAPSAQQGY